MNTTKRLDALAEAQMGGLVTATLRRTESMLGAPEALPFAGSASEFTEARASVSSHHHQSRLQTSASGSDKESTAGRRAARRQLRHHQPGGCDLPQQPVVPARVGDVDPAGEDRDRGGTGGGQRAAVGGGVDAVGTAATDLAVGAGRSQRMCRRCQAARTSRASHTPCAGSRLSEPRQSAAWLSCPWPCESPR